MTAISAQESKDSRKNQKTIISTKWKVYFVVVVVVVAWSCLTGPPDDSARLPIRLLVLVSIIINSCHAWTLCETRPHRPDTLAHANHKINNKQKIRWVSWRFEPSQPVRIISGLGRLSYMIERASKAEIRREEQNEKAEIRRQNLLNEMQLKGP